jgi:hypothetical protein
VPYSSVGSSGKKVTIAALDDDWPGYASDDPDHPDAWQKGIFHT